MSLSRLECLELVQFVHPGSGMRVPDEANVLKLFKSTGRQSSRRVVIFHLLVLVTLSLDPPSKSRIFCIRVRDAAVTKLPFELDKTLK